MNYHINNWDIKNVSKMYDMFRGCSEKIIPLKFRKKQIINTYKDFKDFFK